ncbi:MAG: hypothetical protein ACT4PZ_17355 [Panacagrimonas sp.]
MVRADVETLARELGGDAPEAFGELAPGRVAGLTAALRAARTRQKHQLDTALTRALEHLPFLLRVPVRKVLGI